MYIMENYHRPLWFKARRFGWGWTPCSAEGWFVTIAAALALIGGDWVVLSLAGRLGGGFDALLPPISVWSAVAAMVGWNALVLVPILWICWKTGERPRWRWGNHSRSGPAPPGRGEL